MTKQEQIKEMQEIIGDCLEFDSIDAKLGSGDGYIYINTQKSAEALYNAGYRREATLTYDFIKMAQKHAVQEFVDELRNKCSEVKGYYYSFGNISGVIEELLEEYKK